MAPTSIRVDVEQSNRQLGPYTLVSKIGIGGFGVVWLAEKRTAIATTQFALKLPRDEDIDLEAFKQEAAIWLQASGHPNVLPLIDADIYNDQVVIVSEYVPDGSLAGWLKQHGGKSTSPDVAVELMDGVLAGLTHLHQRRIIHRDLKPENILLQRETPRLADFGIARLLKSTSQSAHVSGTLAYMAPEAFDGKRNEQTDVWSVGVIFYQMLAGHLPYDQPDMVSFIGAIMRHDPQPLPESVPEVLRQIVMKALQRDPDNRYASATEMRRDLREAEHQLWLGGRKTVVDSQTPTLPAMVHKPVDPQPTLPLKPPAHTQPFVPPETANVEPPNVLGTPVTNRKSWTWPVSIAIAAGLLLSGVVLITTYFIRYQFARKTPNTNQTQAATQYSNYVLKQTLTGHADDVLTVAVSPDGKALASGGRDGAVKIWDVKSGTLMRTLTGQTGAVFGVAFSPNGQMVASGSTDNTTKLWDLKSGALVNTLEGHASTVFAVAFSPDGKTLASGSADKTIKLWDVQTGALKHTYTGHDNSVSAVAYSPDGTMVASGSLDRTIRIWAEIEGYSVDAYWNLTGHSNTVFAVAFSPDGKTLASGSFDKTIKLWDMKTGALNATLTGHTNGIRSVAFSSDGNLLISGSDDSTIKLWDARAGALKQTLTGHTGTVNSVAFSPDGRMIASGSSDKTIKLWRVE